MDSFALKLSVIFLFAQNKILCNELHYKMIKPANWGQSIETE